jgi:hypothetical protein
MSAALVAELAWNSGRRLAEEIPELDDGELIRRSTPTGIPAEAIFEMRPSPQADVYCSTYTGVDPEIPSHVAHHWSGFGCQCSSAR